MEAFDAGEKLLVTERNQGSEKIELLVEHDYLTGDHDEIEISVHFYHDGAL